MGRSVHPVERENGRRRVRVYGSVHNAIGGTTQRQAMTEPIHEWFELSYSQYLTIPRSVLQSMPKEWQERFVKCLEELDETINWRPSEGRYWVRLKDSKGRFVEDPLMDYERGRRRITERKDK